MKKTAKKEKKATNFVLLKSKTENFQVQEFYDFMDIIHPNQREKEEPTTSLCPFLEEIPTKVNKTTYKNTIAVVPYVFKGKPTPWGSTTKEVELGHFLSKTGLYRTTEKDWLDKSFNISFSCLVERVTFVVEENTDKIKISLFNFMKKRSVGHRYFTKHSEDTHITFNKKTKNFFITTSRFLNRRRTTNTFKNSFKHILEIIMRIEIKHLTPTHMKKLEKIMGDKLGVSFKYEKEGLGKALAHSICEWFINIRKIKVPNDYFGYLVRHYPGIRKLKKFKMNLGRTILNEKKLIGKKYIKLINDGEYNLTDMKSLENIFGKKYFHLIPKKFLKYTNNSEDSKFNDGFSTIHKPVTLNKNEKLNLIKVIKTLDKNQVSNFISLIVDHLKMKSQLWAFNDKVRVKAKKLDEFNTEHAEWSNLIHLYERNDSTNYIYDKSFIEFMEKPLIQNNKEYDVKILKNDLEYFEEGQVQKHCVRTYLNTYSSIIISIREEENNLNRMTCEFKHGTPTPLDSVGFNRLKDYNQPRAAQSRLKYNALPIEKDWKELKDKINKRFKTYCNSYELQRPKIEIHNKINGNKRVVDLKNNGIEVFDFVVDDLPF